MVWQPYVVRQGDYLTSLAYRSGTDADTIWKDPQNADLSASRESYDMLCPGDLVYLPESPPEEPPAIEGGTNNELSAEVPKVELKLTFVGFDDAPLADADYVVEGGVATPPEGQTSKEGTVTLEVPVTLREFQISFPNHGLTHIIQIGHLDPPTEDSGVRQRLINLGYLTPETELDEDCVAAAVWQFQALHELEATGRIDDGTRDKLVEVHGV
ncbi:MAG: peptidoglycan-binding protein [Polyangiaceae bacterium]